MTIDLDIVENDIQSGIVENNIEVEVVQNNVGVVVEEFVVDVSIQTPEIIVEINNVGESWEQTFESVSKNLKTYPYALRYAAWVLTDITYALPVWPITKTFTYSEWLLVSIQLSGNIPDLTHTTKTLTYNAWVLQSITYS